MNQKYTHTKIYFRDINDALANYTSSINLISSPSITHPDGTKILLSSELQEKIIYCITFIDGKADIQLVKKLFQKKITT